MRPAWRLAIKGLSGRRSRTALLVAAVALSAGLIAAVCCAMTSVQEGLKSRVAETVGVADLQVQAVGRNAFDAALLKTIDAWPEVQSAVARGKEAVSLKGPAGGDGEAVETWGLMPDREYKLRPMHLDAGREVRSDGEIVIDSELSKKLKANVGGRLEVVRFGDPISLEIVGISKPPAFSSWLRPEAYVTLSQLGTIAQKRNRVRIVDVTLKPGNDPERVAATYQKEMPRGLILGVAGRVTSGLEKNIQASRVGMVIAGTLSFLSAAFIIMTGLTTNVTEKQRELAVLRCIGGTKWQLAESQVAVGAIVGLLGALVGTPLGVIGADVLVSLFPDQLPGGFAVSWFGVGLAVVGSILAGVAGAAWPAWRASRSSPLEALAARAQVAKPSGIIACGIIGLALAAAHVGLLMSGWDAQAVFWIDVAVGIPGYFAGYFLLAVPVMWVLNRAVAGPLGRVLAIPGGMLERTVEATPYRHGFTAGAMMVGLAMMIAIWTNGRSVLRDWLDAFPFPDAYVNGLNLSDETREKIARIPGVTGTCAITLQVVKNDSFGIKAIAPPSTTFIGFEPREFFAMTRLDWVQPKDEAGQRRAVERLEQGGAVLVAREFLTAKGLGAGDKVTVQHEGQSHTFDIVGVVSSPGLDIVSQFTDIGDQYLDNAVNAIFGSRADLRAKFGNNAINLIQVGIDPRVDDAGVVKDIRRIVGVGIVGVFSGREIKAEIGKVLQGSMLIMSIVAIGAMLVSCFGVANLIVAGIQARQFEFGVLRAIGAASGQVARLVLGEAVLIALTACLLGTVMGIHAAWAGQRMNSLLIGLTLTLRPPVGAIAAGWAMLATITIGASLPAVLQLAKRRPRELLGAMKG